MPIDTNRFDSGALAQLAGRTEPRMNLPLAPITGGDAMTAQVAQGNAYTKQGVDQQNANSNTLQANNQMPIAQMQAGLEQQKIAVMQQQLKAQQQQTDLQNRQALSAEEINKKQGVYSAVVLGMNQIQADKTLKPEEKAQKLEETKNQILDAAEVHGVISKDQHEQLQKLPAQQVYQIATHEFTMNHFATQGNDKSSEAATMSILGTPTGTGNKATQTQSDINALADLNNQIQQTQSSGQPVDPNLVQQRDQLKNIIEAKGKSPIQQGEKEVAVDNLKQLNKASEAARVDQTNVAVMKNIVNDPNLASGSLANMQVASSKFLAAAASAIGLPYDPKTAPSEAFNDIAVRAQIDFVKMIGQRINQTEWNAAGKAVPQITNTPQGRQLLIGMVDYNNEMKIQQASFMNDYFHQNGSIVGADHAWDNYVTSLGTPYNPKTKQFDGGDKLRSVDYAPFVSDPQYKKAGAVHLQQQAQQSSLYTPENIAHTAQLHNISENEVKAKLGIK